MKNTFSLIGAALLLGSAASAQVVAPFVENFDSYPGTPITVATGTPTATFGGGNWDFVGTVANSRMRIAQSTQVTSSTAPPTTNGNGLAFAVLDSTINATYETSTAVIHIDGLASDVYGGGFVVRVLLKEFSDEADPNDVIAIADGVTAGFEVLNTGLAGPNPGHLGFKEVLLENWNTATPSIQTAWQERVYTITPTFLAANGLVMSNNMLFIIRQRDNSQVEGGDGLAFDNLRIEAAFSADVACDAITAPSSTTGCTTNSATTAITITLRNNSGVDLLSGATIPVSYTVNAGPAVNEIVTLGANLAANASTSYTFTTTTDMSILGQTYAITATAALVGDQNAANDTASKTVQSGLLLTGAWSETFSSAIWSGTPTNGTTAFPAGWTQETADSAGTDSDWYLRNTDTPSTGTGPVADHTTGVSGGTGFYAYVEDAANLAAVAVKTPCMDVSTLAAPTLVFYYHILNGNSGGLSPNQLHVDIVTQPLGTVISDVIPPLNPGVNAWRGATVDLTPYIGQLIEVRFRGRSNGGSTLCDVCLDDVSVVDLQNLGGQLPQFGLATLDVSGAKDVNGFGLDFTTAVTGPLSKTLAHGASLSFAITGVAGQAIVLVAGPLNIGVATFPGIGQLDLGTAASPVPGNVTVIADGTAANGFFNSAFITGASGSMGFALSSNGLPPNFNMTFQAAVYTGGPSVIALSNAVDVTIL